MIRNYEGTTRLQGIGIVEGIKAKNITVGDELVWNYGSTSKVVEIELSKTGKTLKVVTESINLNGEAELFTRKMGAERIVVVKELNPAEEVKEEVKTAEQEIEELEELIIKKSDELTEIQIQIEKAETTEERYKLRDIENPLKWEIWSMIDLLQAKRKENDESIEVLEQAKKFLGYTKKYKDSLFYCEGQGFYRKYKNKYNGITEIDEFENPMWLVEFLKE